MFRKPIKVDKGSKSTQANDQLHKPAKHIEETARLASSVESNKGIEKSPKPRIWRRALTLFILQDNQLSHTVKARLRGISG